MTNLTVIPKPDRDKIDFPDSRYPLSYCLTCGNGFLAYIRCARTDCDLSGEVMPNGQPAVVPANAVNAPGLDWGKLKPVEEPQPTADPWAKLKPPE